MIVNLQTSRMIVSPLCCVGATDSNERRVLTIVAAVPARVLAPLLPLLLHPLPSRYCDILHCEGGAS